MQSLKTLRQTSRLRGQCPCKSEWLFAGITQCHNRLPKSLHDSSVQPISTYGITPELIAPASKSLPLGFAANALVHASNELTRVSRTAGSAVWLRQFSSTSSCQQKQPSVSTPQTLEQAGWTKDAVYNIPNGLSMARLLSGPAIAWLILNEQWGVALVSLAISGASDWADGYVAKQYGHSSVLGSYLDPLADKVLIGCVVGALGYQGSLPMPLVVLIIGRDVVLLTGAFVHRFRSIGWRWPGAAEFFRLSASSSAASPSSTAANADKSGSANALKDQHVSSDSGAVQPQHADSDNRQEQQQGVEDHISTISSFASLQKQPEGTQQEAARHAGQAETSSTNTQPAAFVQPLYISKVNTCFQLLLVGGCLTSSWYSWPSEQALLALGVVTGGTTLASCGAYVRAYLKGTIK